MSESRVQVESTGSDSGTSARAEGFVRSQLAGFEAPALRLGPSWLSPMRRAAIERFRALGLPTTHDEEWRFTSVASLDKIPFTLATAFPQDGEPRSQGRGAVSAGVVPTTVGIDPETVARALVEEAAFGIDGGHRLVFMNGHLVPGLSTALPLPGGARFDSLAAAFETSQPLVAEHFGRHASFEESTFTALNTAFMADGAFLHVPDGVVIEEPLLIVNLSSPAGPPSLSHPRHLLILGRESQAIVIESYAGTNCAIEPRGVGGGAGRGASGGRFEPGSHPEGIYFTNAVTELVVGDGAALRHYKLQDEAVRALHVATIQAWLGKDSVFDSHSVSIGAALARNDIGALLAGEGAACALNGLFIATGTQHVDNHTVIDHALPHGTSREVYKGILDGKSRGVFDGKVVVRPDAQKTDSRQTNRNLLLSDWALINTKPQLEIRADDVKCAHAATIGRLDEPSLFYLRSRGMDLDTARALLIRAFASEVTGLMKLEPLRRRVEQHVSRMLEARGGVGEAA